MQTPVPLSFGSGFLWKMRNVLKQIKDQFSDFYFSSYRENSSKIDSFEYKIDHNSKNRKSENLFFIRFSPFRIFYVNVNAFEK